MTPFLAAAITTMLTSADRTGCSECEFRWDISYASALSDIERAPLSYEALLRSAPVPAGPLPTWTPPAYVWHVADVTRAWAERLHSTVHAPGVPWAGFDPDVLAEARGYPRLPAATAPWALSVAVRALLEVLDAVDPDLGFEHPEWGHGTVRDAVRWVAHEVVHHQLDVSRDARSA